MSSLNFFPGYKNIYEHSLMKWKTIIQGDVPLESLRVKKLRYASLRIFFVF